MCLEIGNLGVLVATLIVMLVVRMFFFVRAAAADFPVEGENKTSDVGRGGAANHLSSPCGLRVGRGRLLVGHHSRAARVVAVRRQHAHILVPRPLPAPSTLVLAGQNRKWALSDLFCT